LVLNQLTDTGNARVAYEKGLFFEGRGFVMVTIRKQQAKPGKYAWISRGY